MNMEEIKAIYSHSGFYPDHYLASALHSDAAEIGVTGDNLKSLKALLEPKLLELDVHSLTQESKELRLSIGEQLFKTLGYYEKSAVGSKEDRILLIGQHKVILRVERRIILKGRGELWLLFSDQPSHQDNVEDFDSDESSDESIVQNAVELPIASNSNRSIRLTWGKVLDSIFIDDDTDCEWLILSNGVSLYLFEQGKWQESRAFLELNLPDLFALNKETLYRTAEALFCPTAFPIDSADFFHEKLAHEAHKKATEVTKALRDTVRESIEILANAILQCHRESPLPSLLKYNFENLQDRQAAAQDIFDQSLKYVYRMLFLFFAESQERAKGALPVHSRPYQMGYAIEKLRDLEGVPLLSETDPASQGNFIQKTLNHAFKIYFEGYNSNSVATSDQDTKDRQTDALGFAFPALGTSLFNPESTPCFNEAKLKDFDMQKVIRRMSLAQTGKGKGKRTHRVHYAGLGLNQLGAVYEGLLALKPEILNQKVVLLAKDDKELAHRYAPYSQIKDIDPKKLAYDEDGNLIIKEKGEFVLTPAGLERKFSASFYTPEVLTRFLAKEAVDALLKADSSLKRMESLKILEPAMGSGAFLNAVVDELSKRMAVIYEKEDREAREKFIEQEQKKGRSAEEIREKAPQVKSFSWYEAKAKNYLMRHSVYGVDLNPTAVELAKVSLWLNCLHEDGNLPFLDFKLRVGNSLIGAWVTKFSDKETNLPHWFIPKGECLDPHLDEKFLNDKKLKLLTNEALAERLRSIQKEFRGAKSDPALLDALRSLNDTTNRLYKEHLNLRADYQNKVRECKSPKEKEILAKEYAEQNKAYNQLRFAMDAWCALWFWPHDKLSLFPNLKDYVQALRWILNENLEYGEQLNQQIDASGIEWLSVARDVALEQRFFHYDLEFAEVFANGGFDLVLGNPPWAPIRWEEADFFELWSPGIHAEKLDAGQLKEKYKKLLKNREVEFSYSLSKTKLVGISNFLKNSGTYPYDDKSTANTYKYFYQRFYTTTRYEGVHAMIAQDGIITDDDNESMRPDFYRELIALYRFANELKLFDVHHNVQYAVWLCRKGKKDVSFDLIDNLYHPETIQKCKSESHNAPYRGMKTDDGKFELRGHPRRIVHVNRDFLKSISLFQNQPNELLSMLPWIHGVFEAEVLKTLAAAKTKLVPEKVFCWDKFDETYGPRDGYFSRLYNTTNDIETKVLTGPNVFVGNPAFKNPGRQMKNNLDFTPINLEDVPDDFFPITVYKATEKGLRSDNYNSLTPWGTRHVDHYRIFARQQVSTTGSRTLQAAILPPGPTHVNSMMSLSFRDEKELVYTSGLFNSLIFDFLMRSISGGTIGKSVYWMTPTLSPEQLKHPLVPALMVRALRLSCVSTHYADLWSRQFQKEFCDFEVESEFEPELPYSKLTKKWTRNTCIRNWRRREQALCEIDAIVAIIFGFPKAKETLLNLYRSQFGALQKRFHDLAGKSDPENPCYFPRYSAMENAYEQALKWLRSHSKKAA